MAFHLFLALSVFAVLSATTQHQPEHSASSTAPAYAPPAWESTSHPLPHTWSSETHTWHTWSSTLYSPLPTSPAPSYVWSSWSSKTQLPHTWSSEPQPPHTWSSKPQPPHTWSSKTQPPHTWSSTVYAPPPPSPPSLLEALNAAGASKFAALIQSDPTVSEVYFSDQVQTIFAPTDEYIDAAFVRVAKRQSLTPQQQQQLLLHATQLQSNINGLRTPPGRVIPTKDKNTKLKGDVQKVVTDPRNKTKSTNNKRWTPLILPRQESTNSTPLVNVYSGLGNDVSILTADLRYSGGFIHTTDGLFTIPLSLSSTAQTTGQTTFVSLANSSNLTSVLDSTELITVFIPTNAAFDTANEAAASAGTGSLLSAHILSDFVGYLPSLTNGSTFTTQAGTSVTVTIQGEDYFINNAKIVSSNLITDNGVAHVIDSVLATSTTIAPYTGAGSSIVHAGTANTLVLALSAVLSFSLLS